MKTKIQIKAWWTLDSRSIPTITCTCIIKNEDTVLASANASVPSGASTGKYEAIELRDNEKYKFHGKGVDKAIENIQKINEELKNLYFNNPIEIDKLMIQMDGTENKSKLGANAILAVSMACHRAFAKLNELELWQYLGYLYFNSNNNNLELYPKLMCNIINGGAHADSGLSFQEFMVIPNTGSILDDIRCASEIYIQLREELKTAGQSTSLGDEGGFAPKLSSTDEAVDFIIKAVNKSNYNENDYTLAFDCAASEYYKNDKYQVDGNEYTRYEMVEYLMDLKCRYNNISLIEDPFDEDDTLGWKLLKDEAGDSFYQIGDDLFVTNIKRFRQIGLEADCANGILIKLNQIGSVFETCQMIIEAHKNNFVCAISHRSGETNDDFIADLAVSSGAKFIKLGAPARGERVAKYNRLIDIFRNIC